MTSSNDTIASVVRRYYATVADLHSTEDDLIRLVSADLRVVEHPNAVTPHGAVRDLSDMLRGFRADKVLLSEQTFDVLEVLVDGDRAAVRATWRGVVGADAGSYRAGQTLVAHIAAVLTIHDGLIVDQETYDCFEPTPERPLS